MKIKSQYSIFDSLINLMPSLENKFKTKDYISSKASSDLFLIWKNGKKINNTTYKRPITISIEEVNNMKKAGLINSINDNIEITKKGQNVIKIMILGDDRSSLEDSEIIIDYNEALNNTNNIKTAKENKFK